MGVRDADSVVALFRVLLRTAQYSRTCSGKNRLLTMSSFKKRGPDEFCHLQ